MATTDTSPFYTVAQAARLLGVAPSTIWRWIAAERLPAYRVGPKNLRIKPSDLEQMIAPTHPPREEARPLNGIPWAETPFVPRRLTPDEKARALEGLDEARKLREAILARRDGQPFDDSTEIIRQAREERSQQLLDI